MTLLTYCPPFSYKVRRVSTAFSFNFLRIICFLMGVTRFFICAFKCEPTLLESSFNISRAFEQIC